MKKRAFWSCFFITLAVLLPVYGAVAMWQYTRAGRVDSPRSGVGLNVPGAGDFKTLLCIARGEGSASFVLVRLDALQNRMAVSALPGECIVLARGLAVTLQQALEDAGPGWAADCLAQTLGIGVDEYICGSSADMAALARALPGVQLNVPRTVTALAPAGYEIYRRPAGLALITAEEGSLLLGLGRFTPGERLTLTQGLYGGILRASASRLAAVLPDAYRKNSAAFTTDISAKELYVYERVLAFLARNGALVTVQAMPGVWDGDSYALTEESLSFAREHFT